MFDHSLRPLKESLYAPLVRATRGVSPTAVSLVGAGVGVGAFAAILLDRPVTACALWLVNRVLDGLDGAVARAQGTATDRGGYLDIVLDTLVYALLPLGVAWNAGTPGALLAGGAVLAALYVNGATWMMLAAILEKRASGAAAHGEMTTVTMPRGLVEGFEAVVIYSVLLLLPDHAALLLWIFAGLVTGTALHRAAWGWRVLR